MCRRNDQDTECEREGLPPRTTLAHRDQRLAYRRTRLIQPPHQSPVRADAKAITPAHASELAWAALIAIGSARIGLWWGGWMSRVRR